jgi:hypothetical protein
MASSRPHGYRRSGALDALFAFCLFLGRSVRVDGARFVLAQKRVAKSYELGRAFLEHAQDRDTLAAADREVPAVGVDGDADAMRQIGVAGSGEKKGELCDRPGWYWHTGEEHRVALCPSRIDGKP